MAKGKNPTQKNKILVLDKKNCFKNPEMSNTPNGVADLNNEIYELEWVSKVEDALSKIHESDFDLIISEMLTGKSQNNLSIEQFMREVENLSKNKRIKVIVLTADADLTNAINCKKSNVEDFVSLPFEIVDLETTIERVLCLR